MNKQKQKTNKTKKRISTIIAILMILALLLTGTYAWVDYSQHRTNTFDNTNSKTYDIYLVEDFEPVPNWTTSDAPKLKNISVMNKGEAPEFGAGYVRLSLKEYFEFSDKTYTYSTNWYALNNSGDYISFDKDMSKADAILEAEALGYYNGVGYETDYTSGVEGWFAIAGADHINGQYGKHMITGIENSTPDSLAPGVERAEYEETENHKLSPTGECAYTPHDWTGVDQFGFRDYVKWNLGPNVISLTEWVTKTETDKDDFKGWIYDDRTTSGYVYWSQPLAPETNTTKLLETVELINQPSGDFYYALHVDMETLSLDELAKEVYEWQDAPSTVIEYWLGKKRHEVVETDENVSQEEIGMFVFDTEFEDANYVESFFGVSAQNVILNIGNHPENDYLIDWGDGTIISNSPEHTYNVPGIYTITLYGKLPGGIKFGSSQDESGVKDGCGDIRLIKVLKPLPAQESELANWIFSHCYYLNEIPEDLFINNPHLKYFDETFFGCESLTSIPENLFSYNKQATYFWETFDQCTGLTSIPENLFVNNYNIKELVGVFSKCFGINTLLPTWWLETETKFPHLERQGYIFNNCNGAPNYSDAQAAGWA